MDQTVLSNSNDGSEKLPKLTPAEHKIYNHMAVNMEWFHGNFKTDWAILYGACTSGKRPAGMSIKQFLGTAEYFSWKLNAHHGIEEEHIFPLLAVKMPQFRKELELLNQHKQIHAGLERLDDYIRRCKSGEIELQLKEFKVVLDSFGEVLWAHLTDEVKTLEAENMRKYWTLQEMKRLPL